MFPPSLAKISENDQIKESCRAALRTFIHTGTIEVEEHDAVTYSADDVQEQEVPQTQKLCSECGRPENKPCQQCTDCEKVKKTISKQILYSQVSHD